MEELNAPIFAQAKIEYTNQLIDALYPHMFDGIKSIYDESKVIYTKKPSTPIFMLFREILEKVPIWNVEILDSECSRIINNSGCDWIDDLITAVFISHTKILTSIGPNQSSSKINVTIPKTVNFIHKCYINLAREIWKNPYLFNESIPGHEYQRNSKEIENIIKQCIETTIRKLLPIKERLREHLDTYDSDSINSKDELKSIIKEELTELRNEIRKNKNESVISDNDGGNDDSNDGNINDNGSIDDSKDDSKDDSNDSNDDSKDSKDDLNNKLNDLLESLKEDNLENQNECSTTKEPTDEDIDNNIVDIVVNDITIPVEDEKEIQYDNVDITRRDENNPMEDKLKVYLDNNDHLPTFFADTVPDLSKGNPLPIPVLEDNPLEDNPSTVLEDNPSTVIEDNPSTVIEDNPSTVLEDNPSTVLEDNPSTVLHNPFVDTPLIIDKTVDVVAEVDVKDSEIIKKNTVLDNIFSLDNIFKSETGGSKEEGIASPKPLVKTTEPQKTQTLEPLEPLEPLKLKPLKHAKTNSQVSVEVKKLDYIKGDTILGNDDIDETSSLANFFDDIKQIADDKKIDINTGGNFLFADAGETDI